MRILCVLKWLINGGAEKNAVNIINYLAENNENTIDVLVMENTEDQYLLELLSPKVNKIYFLNSKIEKFSFFLTSSKSYTHVFAGDHRLGAYLSTIRFITPHLKWKIICRCINNLSILLMNKKKTQKKIFSYFFNKIDLVISQCEGMSDDLTSNWKVNNVVTVYNPITRKTKNHKVISNKDNEVRFLYTGRFSHQKRLLFMLKAFHHALTLIDKKVTLTLVGYRDWMDEDNKIYDELQSYIINNDLSKHVFIENYTTNLSDLFYNSHVFLLTSIYEGFPNVLIEANSYGIPVISTDCNFGPNEIIEEGTNGYLSDLNSIDEFSKYIVSSVYKDWDNLKIISTTSIYHKDIQYKKLLDRISEI
ncbi:glycosyltransferase [Providencia sp. PROV144]|uniref:glycosyltransferase n=1 Tax=Providencia sp. PROV144 TaxID=2949854 RepID=UPI00234A0A82|nr:glycosyltransferase [Providencia sp. PROV144]